MEPGSQGCYYFDIEKLFETKLTEKQHYQSRQKDALHFLEASKKYTELLNTNRAERRATLASLFPHQRIPDFLFFIFLR